MKSAQSRIKSISNAKYGYLFALPFVIVYLIFHFYPTLYTTVLGFTDCQGLNNTEWNLLKGNIFANYSAILSNKTFQTAEIGRAHV